MKLMQGRRGGHLPDFLATVQNKEVVALEVYTLSGRSVVSSMRKRG